MGQRFSFTLCNLFDVFRENSLILLLFLGKNCPTPWCRVIRVNKLQLSILLVYHVHSPERRVLDRFVVPSCGKIHFGERTSTAFGTIMLSLPLSSCSNEILQANVEDKSPFMTNMRISKYSSWWWNLFRKRCDLVSKNRIDLIPKQNAGF